MFIPTFLIKSQSNIGFAHFLKSFNKFFLFFVSHYLLIFTFNVDAQPSREQAEGQNQPVLPAGRPEAICSVASKLFRRLIL